MDILFGLIGIVFLLTATAGFLFCVIYMARRMGFIKVSDETDSENSAIQSYLANVGRLKKSLVFRFSLIALLVGLLNIPLNMVSNLVMERSQLYHQVLADIASTWGHEQKIQGPVLLIPYTEKFVSIKLLTDKDGNERKVNKTSYQHKTAIVLPDQLSIDVNLLSQTRKRSLYESLVYTSDLKLTGSFKRPDITRLSNNIDKIHWDKAWLSVGLSDTQAINNVSKLTWSTNGTEPHKIDFEPGTKIVKTIASGFHALVNLSNQPEHGDYPFSLTMNVNGSNGFYFSPIGKITQVNIKSDWPHPSFQGDVLPNHHQIDKQGFSAEWSIPHLARNYPQIWRLETDHFNINDFNAGVNLFESVSLYSKITRAIKYGSLFFILTYITFLIFEMGIGKRLHIVQYGMIGLALSMFYLTLLSMAEQSGFFNAYISAAGIIITMISLYAYAAIRSVTKISIIAILLSGLYFILYSLLKLEDHALMGGTVLLLVILAVMMYMTRNIGKDELL